MITDDNSRELLVANNNVINERTHNTDTGLTSSLVHNMCTVITVTKHWLSHASIMHASQCRLMASSHRKHRQQKTLLSCLVLSVFAV